MKRRAMWLAGILTCSTAACAEIAGLGPAPSDDAGGSDSGPSTVGDAADAAPDVASDAAPDVTADTAPADTADTATDDIADTAPDAADTAPDDASDGDAFEPGLQALSLPPLVHLVQGETASLTVTVNRFVYGGDVVVELLGLPIGVTAAATTIPAASSAGTITLSATTSATLGPVQLTATAPGLSAWGPGDIATLLVQGPPGTVDTTFGVNGIARAPFDSPPRYMALATQQGIALAPDGRILLCGNVWISNEQYLFATALVRLEADGSLDTTFNNGSGTVPGAVLYEQTNASSWPTACGLVASSGLILLGGFSQILTESYHSLFAAAFASNGSLDSSYGPHQGVYETDLDMDSKVAGMAVSADGSMVAVGFNGSTWELFRLTAAGELDPTFGPSNTGSDAGGIVGIPGVVTVDSVGYLSDGRLIVFVGSSSGWWLERYSADGVLDETYGDAGSGQAVTLASLGFGVVLPDDSVVVGGLTADDAGTAGGAIGLAHFRTDGQLDPGFGSAGTGTTTTNLPDGGSQYIAIAVGEDGRIATALSLGDSQNSFSAAVFLPTGALDTSFGDGGIVTTNAGANALANDVAIDAFGRILVAGTAADPNDYSKMDAVVVRYWP